VPVAAAPPSEPFVHESWTVKDGLPVNSVNKLLQSRDGYLWAATFNGLVRFDGVRFTVFNSANTAGLPSDRIFSLLETRDGSLWIRTEQFHLVRFRDGAFTHIGRGRGLTQPAYSMYEAPDGVLWVGTARGVGSIRGGRFTPVAEGTLAEPVVSLLTRRDGSLWAGTSGRGLYRIAGGRATKVAGGPLLDTATVRTLYEDAARTMWIGTAAGGWTEQGGLQPIAASGPRLHDISSFLPSPVSGEMFIYAESGVYRVGARGAALIDPRGAGELLDALLWADSAAVWHARGNEILRDGRRVYALPVESTDPLPATTVRTAIFDHEGSLWLGTHAGGLHRLKPALFRVYGEPEGLAYRNVYTVYEDRSGAVWVGTWGKGLSRIGPGRSGRVTTFGVGRGVPATINSLLEDPTGALWLGAADGLFRCTLPTIACTAEGPAALGRAAVLALHGDADGRVWAGSAAGLFRLDGRSWTRLPESAGAPAEQVRAFVETRDGALWMGTNGGGVARYHEGRFSRVTTADGLPSDLVRSLHQDADGWLWIGTEGRGLARLDPRAWGRGARGDRRIVHVRSTDGLFDDVIHQILEDDFGRLWMSTNRGIFWVARRELLAFAAGRTRRINSTGYTERDGLRNREANGGVQPAGIKARDGRLWFATQDGVAVVDPARVRTTSVAPNVVIERVIAGGAVVRPRAALVELGVEQRDLEIDYTALSFLAPGNVRFRYRLEPYDDEWVDAGSRRTAFYTQVPPGRYTFRVRASIVDGVWTEAGARLALRLLPRFHETGRFRLLALVAVGLLIVTGFGWRLRSLRARTVQLGRVVDERTRALREREVQLQSRNAELATLHEARSRLFANLSHEFRTPLTLILGPLGSLLEGRHGTLPPSVREQHQLMKRNGHRLLRLINQILDLTRLQVGAVTLDRRPHDLVGFVRPQVLAFAPLAERQRIALRFRSPLPELRVGFDTEQLEKVLLNLLSNAIKFTPPGGEVEVSLAADADAVEITVRDTGIGIAAGELPRVFERFFQADASETRRYEGTGIGLALAKELVELHGGTIRAESEPGVGSAFTVRLGLDAGVVEPATGARGPGEAAPLALPSDVGGATRASAPASVGAIEDREEAGLALDERPWDEQAQDGEAPDRTTVLVVDDNPDVRAYVRSVLGASYRVIEAGDGRAGLEVAVAALPDLIVADVMMPELDGLALGRALRTDPLTDAIPLILLTARAAPEDQVAGFHSGADGYLLKPFEPSVLVAQVAGLLAQRRRLRDRFRQGEDVPPATAPSEPSALDLLLRPLIEARLTEPGFGPDALADAAGLSYHQLYRALRDELDTTPSRFIRTVRVECAAALLRSGAGSITEIAYSVGFESLSYFRRAFRERFGTSPSDHLAAQASAPLA